MEEITSHYRRNLGALLDPTLNIHSMHQTKSSGGAGAQHRRAPPPDPTIIRTVSEHKKSLSATHLLHPPSSVIHSVGLGKSKSQRKATQQKSSDESKKKKEKCEIELMTHLFSHHNPNTNNNVKVVSVDMPPFMQIHALNFATNAYHTLQNFTPKALALALKKRRWCEGFTIGKQSAINDQGCSAKWLAAISDGPSSQGTLSTNGICDCPRKNPRSGNKLSQGIKQRQRLSMIFQQQRFSQLRVVCDRRGGHRTLVLSDEFQQSDEKLLSTMEVCVLRVETHAPGGYSLIPRPGVVLLSRRPVALLCSKFDGGGGRLSSATGSVHSSRNPCSGSINDAALRWLFYLVDFPLLFFEAFEGEEASYGGV
nr:Dynein light chain [Ipomoea batatas]